MDTKLVQNLLIYIVNELQDIDAPISTIRLVKLLYLIDENYYELHSKTLTGIKWISYKYGPYFFELPNVLRASSLDLEAQEVMTERGKGVTYSALKFKDVSKYIDFPTENIIRKITRQWGVEDLENLLNYVYSTAPVKCSERGELINFKCLEVSHEFSSLSPHIILNRKQSKEIQKLLAERHQQTRDQPSKPIYDEYYLQAIRIMDTEDSNIKKRIGNRSIKFTPEAKKLLGNHSE